MTDYMMLDSQSIYAFQALYPGDIEACSDATHISFGAFSDYDPAALIVLRIEDNEVFVEWMYTAEEKRNQGIMSGLFDYTRERAELIDRVTLLRIIFYGDALKDFLDRKGFYFLEDDSTTYISSLKDMRDIPDNTSDAEVIKLSDMDRAQMNAVNLSLMHSEEADAVALPVTASEYSNFSCATLAGNELKALLLFGQDRDDIIEIKYAFKAAGAEADLVKLINYASTQIRNEFSGDIKLRATAINSSSEKLLDDLFPDAVKEKIYNGQANLF